MSNRRAYLFELWKDPFDLLELSRSLDSGGLTVRNPGSGRVTRLSSGGDQIETVEKDLESLIRNHGGVPFQTWADHRVDVFCQLDYLRNNLVRHCYEVSGLYAESRDRRRSRTDTLLRSGSLRESPQLLEHSQAVPARHRQA